MTPAPAQLPREEIENLLALAMIGPHVCVSADRMRALLAEIEAGRPLRQEVDEALQLTESCSTLKQMATACIEGAAWKLEAEAGRAGAERVTDIRVKDLEAKVLETVMYVRRNTPNHSAKALTAAVVRTVVAALRQAAQPSDLETAFRMGFMYGQGTDPAFTADEAWSISETKLRAQAAQPAGREDARVRRILRQCLEQMQGCARDHYGENPEGLAKPPLHAEIEELLAASPPTAGAVDDQENGR
jgi:hypothetical protein